MTEPPRFLSARPNLEVTDLDRAIAFYEGALGLEVRIRAPEFGLAVLGPEGGCELARMQRPEPRAASCYLLVSGVNALHARCLEAGASPASPLQTHPYGMRDFVLEDPDGNRVAVGERRTPAP